MTTRSVLAQLDRAQQHYRLAIAGALLWEGLLLLLLLWATDFRNKTHLLILVSTVGSYTLIVLGLIALAALIQRNTLRILQGLELVQQEGPSASANRSL